MCSAFNAGGPFFYWLNVVGLLGHFFAVADQKAKEAAMEDRIIRVREVVIICGVSRDTIRRMEQRGQFPRRVKIGGSVGWRLSEIRQWLAERN